MAATADFGQVIGRGVGFPVRLGADGHWAWATGEEDVRECIEIILRTDPGERLRLPSFGGGLEAALFEPNVPATHRDLEHRIARALADWEPRVTVLSVTVAPDDVDPEMATATITFRLVATQATQRVALQIGAIA